MRSRSGITRKWRKLNRKYGVPLLIGFMILVAVAVVGLLMYVLSSPDWRARW
jgi:hypothetical protein